MVMFISPLKPSWSFRRYLIQEAASLRVSVEYASAETRAADVS